MSWRERFVDPMASVGPRLRKPAVQKPVPHIEPHPQRGQTVHLLHHDQVSDFVVEDWWDRVSKRAPEDFGTMVYGTVDGEGRLVYDADLYPTGPL